MKARRLLPELWRLLLHGLMLFPGFVLIEFALEKGGRPWGLTLALLPALISYPAARLTLRLSLERSVPVALLTALAAVGISAGIGAALGSTVLLWLLLCAAVTVGLFYFFRLYTPELGSVRFTVGVLLYLLIGVCVFFHPEPFAPFPAVCNPLAILFVVLGVFSLGEVNLRNGMRAEDGRAAYPSGMRSGTGLLIAGVLALALLLANLGAVRDLFLATVNGILFLAARLVDLLVALTRPHGGVNTPEPTMDFEAILGDTSGTVSPFFRWFVLIFGTVALIALAVGAGVLLFRAGRYLSRKLRALLARLRQTGTELEDLGFRDERESLFDPGALTEPLRDAFRRFAGRFRREPELDPAAPPREQVRFVYRQFLRHRQDKGPELQALTPREAMEDRRYAPVLDQRQLRQFAEFYDRARYSDGELDPSAGELARSIKEKV